MMIKFICGANYICAIGNVAVAFILKLNGDTASATYYLCGGILNYVIAESLNGN
jgi:hypothetical protein